MINNNLKKKVFEEYLAKYNEKPNNIYIIPDNGMIKYDNLIYNILDDDDITDKYKQLKSNIIKELQDIKDNYVLSKYENFLHIEEGLINEYVEDLSPKYILEEFNYNLLDIISIDNNDYYIVEPC